MVQKHSAFNSLALEIINAVMEGEMLHARGIAQKLGTNHTVILRRVKDLIEANVLDFAQKGRNKQYFLKKTAEAEAFAVMAESFKLAKTLQKYPLLRGIVEKIRLDGRIRLAVLFGSFAKGTAAKNSDIDVFIETTDRNLKKELSLLDSKLSIKIGLADLKEPLFKEIEKTHVIIKGVEEFLEKTKFFEKTS
jgi:predicted nucleotidyltransferase